MKTIMLTTMLLISLSGLHKNSDSKLKIIFNKTFPSAENIKWFENANGSVVFFKVNRISNRISYDTEDNFIEQDRYYYGDNLPAYILLAINKRFPEKNISGVTEVTNSSTIYYQVNLKDNKDLYIIKVSMDASISVEKTLTNAEAN